MRRISPISWVLIVLGVAFVVVGVIYLTTTPPNLPGFLPGHLTAKVGHKYTKKYSKRGLAAFAVAVAAFVGVYYNDFRHRH